MTDVIPFSDSEPPRLPLPEMPELEPELEDPPLDVTVSWSTEDWDAHRRKQRAIRDSNAVRRRAGIKESNRIIRANELARLAHEQGVNETLEVMVPNIIDTILQVQDLTGKSLHLIDEAIHARDVDMLKAAGPVMKTLLVESNKLLDRVAGKAVQRQEVKQESTNTNINVHAQVTLTLDELVAQRSRASSVVEGEVIG